MIDLIVTYLANINTSLLIIIITSLAGSYGKDYLRIMKSTRPEKVSLSNVFLSTFTATLVIYGFSDMLVEKFGDKFLAFASFVCGLVGFQLMEKLSTIDGVLGLIKQVKGVESNVPKEPKEDNSEPASDTK